MNRKSQAGKSLAEFPFGSEDRMKQMEEIGDYLRSITFFFKSDLSVLSLRK